MKKSTLILVLGAVAVALAIGLAGARLLLKSAHPDSGPTVELSASRLSGPYTCNNLTIFLIHGQNQLPGRDFLTLQEALELNRAVVHETGQANELTIENLSPSEEIFLQAGEIVSGERQDRVLQHDLVVPPRSGKMRLASLGVASGRWSPRAPDNGAGLALDVLAHRDVKLAARSAAVAGDAGGPVAVSEARGVTDGANLRLALPARLEKTLACRRLDPALEPFLQKLGPIAAGQSDVIGFVFAVNGQVNSAEAYGTSELFHTLWPKLLRAAAVEALAERHSPRLSEPVSSDAARACLIDAESGPAAIQPVNGHVQMVRHETGTALLVETRDQEQSPAWIHRSYLKK